MGPKKDPPPPPPPRPYRTHGRSSSLDLNHIGRSASLHAPPAPPPRISPNSVSNHSCETGRATFWKNTNVVLGNRWKALSLSVVSAFLTQDFQIKKHWDNNFVTNPGSIMSIQFYIHLWNEILYCWLQTSPHKLPCDEDAVNGSEAPRRHGAFHVYRKSNST